MASTSRYIDETALMQEFWQDRGEALQVIYDFHYHTLWNYAFGIVDDEAVASDIVIVAFEKLWERRAKMTSLKHLVSFLYVVVRNGSLYHLKGARARKRIMRKSPISTGSSPLMRMMPPSSGRSSSSLPSLRRRICLRKCAESS